MRFPVRVVLQSAIDPGFLSSRFTSPRYVDGEFVPGRFRDQPTQDEVAEDAHLSGGKQLVSQVLKGAIEPDTDTARRVYEAADRIGYWYSPYRQDLDAEQLRALRQAVAQQLEARGAADSAHPRSDTREERTTSADPSTFSAVDYRLGPDSWAVRGAVAPGDPAGVADVLDMVGGRVQWSSGRRQFGPDVWYAADPNGRVPRTGTQGRAQQLRPSDAVGDGVVLTPLGGAAVAGELGARIAIPEVFQPAYASVLVERTEAAAELAKAAAEAGANPTALRSDEFEQELAVTRQRLDERGVPAAERVVADMRAITLRYREVATMVRRLEELGGVSKAATPSRHRLLTNHAAAVLSRLEAAQRLRADAAATGAESVPLSGYSEAAEAVRRWERAITEHEAVVAGRVSSADPSTSRQVREIRSLSAGTREVTVRFGWGEARTVEAAASALGETLREWGWHDQHRITAATETARIAALDALRFIRDFPAVTELSQFGSQEGLPGMMAGSRPDGEVDHTFIRSMLLPRVQLTVRLSSNPEIRSLHISVECDQFRAVGPLDETLLRRLDEIVPQHSAAAVGEDVFQSLAAAARWGVESHGEVWASFEEARLVDESPGPGDGMVESPDQANQDFEAKKRLVERLYDEHHVRLLGWEGSDFPVESVASAVRNMRDLIAEYKGRHKLREVRFVDENYLRTIDPLNSSALTYYCGTRYIGPNENYYAVVAIDRRSAVDPEWASETLQRSREAGWWGWAPGDILSAILRHEFRHVVDQSRGITRSGSRVGDRLKAAHEVYRVSGLPSVAETSDIWVAGLPRYAFIGGDPARGLDDKETLAEGGLAGASDPTLPLTDPARVVHGLTHRLDPVEYART
ncbi:hypothetical protein B0T44_25975, partial [Nocardia donostiensis]|uniref:hypothetical protein n=1 Tax=Nocardia donostiensis TaxID=1538463 RepID=UPI0009F136AD